MEPVRPALLLAALVLASSAAAQPYPSRPIRLIIPMAAGGATDILVRTVTPRVSELFGQQIVVDNRPAANGVLGDEMATKAAPDGYTLHANSIAISINPSLYKLNYDIRRDLTPITQLAYCDLLLGVHAKLPVKTVQDLIAQAKAQPGKLNYASFGVGSIAHIAAEMLKQAHQLNVVHVPYNSAPLAVQGTISGQTHMLFGCTSYMLPQARAGRLIGVGIGSSKRNPVYEDVPTLAEQGLAGFDVIAWFGMWMPPRTPKPIVNHVYGAVAQALKERTPAIEKLGYRVGGEPPEEFARYVNAQVEKFANVVKSAGIRPEN